MATFEFTSPEGKTYTVNGPEGATQDQAWGILQQQLQFEKDAANYAGGRGFTATDQLAHAATMGLTRPLNAAVVAAGPAVKNLLGINGGSLADQVTGKQPETAAEAWQRAEREYDAARAKYAGEHPILAPTLSVAGGVAALGPSRAAGAPTMLNTIRQSAQTGAVYGGISGVSEANGDLGERAISGAKGVGVGGTIGAVLPPALAVGRSIISPLTSQVSARMNPEAYAGRQFARMVEESGVPPQQIARDVVQASQEGQPVYAVADAMGNAGQRGLSTVARSPGPGRAETVNFLDTRQADQGRRVSNALAEGFNAPETAAATTTRLEAARAAAADANYDAARQLAGTVNVTPAIRLADAYLQPGVTGLARPSTNIADNSIESAVRRARSYLTDGRSQVTRFEDAFQAKQEIDNIIDTATRSQQRVLIPIRNALDNQLAAASRPYAVARDTFRRQSQEIDAIDVGRNASQRGRYEDTIRQFNGMTPGQQQSFRVGYVDPEIARVQGAAFGANKARPYTSDAFAAESAAMAPRAAEMNRRMTRENRMFETRATALGGSKTFDNIADNVAMGLSPEAIAQAVTGGVRGVVRHSLTAAANALTGNTAAVRQEVGRLLRMNGMNSSQAQITAILQRANQLNVIRHQSSSALQRGLIGSSLGVLDNAAHP